MRTGAIVCTFICCLYLFFHSVSVESDRTVLSRGTLVSNYSVLQRHQVLTSNQLIEIYRFPPLSYVVHPKQSFQCVNQMQIHNSSVILSTLATAYPHFFLPKRLAALKQSNFRTKLMPYF